MASGRTGVRRRAGTSERDLTEKADLEFVSTDKDHVVALPTLEDPKRFENIHTNCRQGKKRKCTKCKKNIDLCKLNAETPLNQLPVIDLHGMDGPNYWHYKCATASHKNKVAQIMREAKAAPKKVVA